jgi:hypothetical protein
VTFTGTDILGIYTVSPHLASGSATSAAPSIAPASPTAIVPSAGPGASGAPAGSRAPVDPNGPTRFAVDLFDVNESTISPGSAAAIEALGRGPAASPVPSGTAGGGAAATTERPTARDELWVPIVLIVLVVLCVEWAVYQRDAVVRLRRGLAARFGRAADGRA